MTRKPKNFKRILKLNDDELSFAGYTVDMIETMIKAWIKFLEKESFKTGTEYPRGHFQAEILREIFDIKD